MQRDFPHDLEESASKAILLSVIIPGYNEERTIGELLTRVAAADYVQQIVVIDDGSNDGTFAIIEDWQQRVDRDMCVSVLRHPVNRGKGAAIRSGLQAVCGRIVIIQDADLEYDPADYPLLIEPILNREAEIVYGSRYLGQNSNLPWTINRFCVQLLNLMVLIFYGQRISDEATCYKAFRTDLLRCMDLRCERFEFCPEVTAKACRLGIHLREVPIHYVPRTAEGGKKIGWVDGWQAINTLLYWRFAPFMRASSTASFHG